MVQKPSAVRSEAEWNKTLLVFAALLSIFTLGITASVLESVPTTSPYEVSTTASDGPALSPLAILLLLFDTLFGFLGIEIELSASAGGMISIGAILALTLDVLGSIGLPLLVVCGVGITILVVSRHLPHSPPTSVRSLLMNWPQSTKLSTYPNSTDDNWPPSEPKHDVFETWVAMTEQLEIEHPHSRTPREWAESAIDAGFDEDTIETLTDALRQIRYADSTTTIEISQDTELVLEQLEDDTE
ncbi:DUF4129 domain-containing protein [Halalkalicoccus subterraneus]|uniref:DUF4129 domain-containing protein n=1 Tax=Halalkalicoccus subterraneus TaxID=2675002 RepID=UPI000EFB3606|nr:DUF4129 domain-containing protein [Halalkalicoccus subterraneus]